MSETLGLKWEDFDWGQKVVAIQRSAYRGAIDETKTVFSKDKLPLAPALVALLLEWRKQSLHERRKDWPETPELEWVFANPATEMPYISSSLQQRWIRPCTHSPSIHFFSWARLNRQSRPIRRPPGTWPFVAIIRKVLGWHLRNNAAS